MALITLIRLSGWAALGAGVLRMGASFVPYTVALEWLYFVIDVLLLLGLLGIYACQHEQIGVVGLLGFLSALIGTASIIGPDGEIGGVAMYVVGSMMISLGLSVLALGTWTAHILPRAVPILWWLSTAIGVGGFIAGEQTITFLLAGIAFGLAFVFAGFALSGFRATVGRKVAGT